MRQYGNIEGSSCEVGVADTVEQVERLRGAWPQFQQHPNNEGSSYEVGVADTVEQVERLRGAWRQFQLHPNADIDFYLTVVESRPSILRPYIVYVKSGQEIVSMAVGRIEECKLELKVGYKSLYKPKIKSLTIVYGGLIGDSSGYVTELLMAELLSVFKNRDVDVLTLHSLPDDCHLLDCARKHGRFSQYSSNSHWSLRSPVNMDQFFEKMGRKHRQWVRRLPRLLEKDYPGGILSRSFSSEEDIPALCHSVEKIAKCTYQRALGVGFIDDRETRNRLILAASKGWLRAHVLYIEEDPCAFWIGTKYNRTYYLDYTGYDPRYEKYSPGIILFVRMLEAILPEGSDTIDFGFGDATYKQRFGDRKWQEISVNVFAPTVRARLLYLCSACVCQISLFTAKTLERAKLRDRVKKLWRGKLTEVSEK